jgi:hypothetical protein
MGSRSAVAGVEEAGVDREAAVDRVAAEEGAQLRLLVGGVEAVAGDLRRRFALVREAEEEVAGAQILPAQQPFDRGPLRLDGRSLGARVAPWKTRMAARTSAASAAAARTSLPFPATAGICPVLCPPAVDR